MHNSGRRLFDLTNICAVDCHTPASDLDLCNFDLHKVVRGYSGGEVGSVWRGRPGKTGDRDIGQLQGADH